MELRTDRHRASTLENVWIVPADPVKLEIMRMLLQVSISHEPFNAAVRDGTAGQKLSRIVDETRPEAVYFTEQHGQRGAIMIVEMSDPSKIPALAEPWFLTFNATVEFRVVMTPDDLQKASLDEVGKKWA
jgi:hypothetical protein